MKFLQYIICILLFSTNIKLFSQTPAELFQEANNAYQSENYEKAGELYEQILDKGYIAPEVYFNLGNTYFKSNQIARAILNYERAKLYDPANEDINYNLELARTRIVDRIEILPQLEFISWWKNMIHSYSPLTWAMLSILCFTLFLGFLLVYFFSSRSGIKRLFFWLALPVFIISIVTFSFSKTQNQYITNHDKAIVITPTITVKGSPDEESTDLFVLHEGTKVTLEDQIGDWREIKLSDGNKGWIKAEAVEAI